MALVALAVVGCAATGKDVVSDGRGRARAVEVSRVDR